MMGISFFLLKYYLKDFFFWFCHFRHSFLLLETNYDKNELYSSPSASTLNERQQQQQQLHGNNLNINVPENNAVLRLEVELRDKHQRHDRGGGGAMGRRAGVPAAGVKRNGGQHNRDDTSNSYMVPMEKVSALRLYIIKNK